MRQLKIFRQRPGGKVILPVSVDHDFDAPSRSITGGRRSQAPVELRIVIYWACIVALLAAVTFIHNPAGAFARGHPVGPFDSVRIRYEGYLKAIGAGKWLIGDLTILVDRNTAVIEKRGRAEVGAWVVVFGIRSDEGAVYGEIIQVERPAGRSGPIWQFSGLVSKQIGSWWVIGDMLVEVTGDTQVIGHPGPNWLVWVVAEQRVTELRALVIEAIADSPAAVPVEFKGFLESLTSDGGIVDGRRFVYAGDVVIIGEPAVGRLAEIQATPTPDGTLLAHFLRVIPPPATASAMRTTATANGESLWPLAAGSRNDVAITPWKGPNLIANGMADASHPTLAYAPDGTAHAVWESGGYLFHAMRRNGDTWEAARQIWMGREPSLAVAGDGKVHLVFTNQFYNRQEIYHSQYLAGEWTLPVNVSRTSGISKHSALAVEGNSTLRAAWMDDTPGYWVIYAARWSGGFWSSQPIPNARGQFPAVAVASNGRASFAWQERTPTVDNPTGNFNIFLCEHSTDGWSLPVNISDSSKLDAEMVSLTRAPDGMAYLVWVEGGRTVRWSFGQGFYWPEAQTLVQAARMARGPRIAFDHGQILYVAWDEGDMVRAAYTSGPPGTWPKPEVVMTSAGALKDVWLTGEKDGATLAWIQTAEPSGASIYIAQRMQGPRQRTWLPILMAP